VDAQHFSLTEEDVPKLVIADMRGSSMKKFFYDGRGDMGMMVMTIYFHRILIHIGVGGGDLSLDAVTPLRLVSLSLGRGHHNRGCEGLGQRLLRGEAQGWSPRSRSVSSIATLLYPGGRGLLKGVSMLALSATTILTCTRLPACLPAAVAQVGGAVA
jgi:hypothetical protein